MSDTKGLPRWLMTVVLLASLFGNARQILQEVKAWNLGISSSYLAQALEQEDLWKKNIPCLQASPIYTQLLSDDTEVGVTLCQSGDALLKYMIPDRNPKYTWVKFPGKLRQFTQSSSHIIYGRVRCLWLSGLYILAVLQSASNSSVCEQETIAFTTGEVLDLHTVVCSLCDMAT